MAKKYESFPPCCQKILELLEREQRRGARNCEKGHLVSIEYAEQLERQAAAKKLKDDAAAAAAVAKPVA